ncbi:hypothetical protein DPMN_023534 [Dreissena polymorpha]|uniref:Uncharacterized protein n=1 Tax=Dreissena polymorpha TaxID=45954 RepID=A0A9D4RA03_DREPO|nr:hypothetical protein DPMN_023534 [Dreissena polymorpha]
MGPQQPSICSIYLHFVLKVCVRTQRINQLTDDLALLYGRHPGADHVAMATENRVDPVEVHLKNKVIFICVDF